MRRSYIKPLKISRGAAGTVNASARIEVPGRRLSGGTVGVFARRYGKICDNSHLIFNIDVMKHRDDGDDD